MDCVVTGGAGFIGSNVVDALLARGDHVTVIDNLATGKPENLADAMAAGAELCELDVRDRDEVAGALLNAHPEVVFHLAAQIDVRRSVEDPAFDASVNVLGTLNVLAAAKRAGVRRFVNTSSGGGLYGDAELLPTPEWYPIRPLAAYGQSKLAAEGYCDLFTRTEGLPTVSLRYGNVYGPRQDVHGEAGVVAIFCGCLLDGRVPHVFGDGKQTRDWIEVSDVVRANLLAADADLSGGLNIATGAETSVLDLIECLRTVGARHDLRLRSPSFRPERPGEVARSRLDVTRARELLGFRAQMRLEEGLERILADLA